MAMALPSKASTTLMEALRESQIEVLSLESEEDGASTGSTPTLSSAAGRRASIQEIPEIAKRENLLVRYSRALVFLVLLLSAAAVAFMTWKFVSDEEVEDYKAQFANDAKELIDVSERNANNIFAVLEIFSTLMSSNAAQTDQRWPFYTLPDYEFFGAGARSLSGALLIAFTPLVTADDRPGWENYTVTNQGWIQDGLDVLSAQSGTTFRAPRDILPFIYRKTARSFVPETNDATLYSPIWQISPAPSDTSIVNFNLFNHPTFRRLVEFAIFTRQAAISEVLDVSLVFGTSAPQKGEDPQSIVVLPVFEQVGNRDSNIIGHVVAVIPWGLFFDNVLQDGQQEGIYCVLRESCGQVFTYKVDGVNATFLGDEDLHEEMYDGDVRSASFAAYDGVLSGIPGLADAHCQYQLQVYPSSEYEEGFQTNRRIVFTIGVFCVFLFTSAVFIMYDCFVRRRQHKVHNVAVKSNAIVTSLFPAQVRDKLFKDHKKESTNAANPFKRNDENSGARFDEDGRPIPQDQTNKSTATHNKDDDAPIADLFPSATVLFMDIAGFTAWSSAREPTQVFQLLETIYRSFDKIAKHRRVFKVETIGDCYVAVCGLPEPNEEHAIVMARFARDCLDKMIELTHRLEVTLGPDTGDLAMRVGLHSGPVTAGVLRGDRARFQLFGDTVNTAARMESTGIKKRIQVSQETADLIIAKGKAHWIKQREDVVVAKGKGELQTYWLQPKHEVASTTNSVSEGNTESEDPFGDMEWIAAASDGSGSVGGPEPHSPNDDKIQRLVDYNSDILLQILKKIVAKRSVNESRNSNNKISNSRREKAAMLESKSVRELEESIGKSDICLNEVVEIISLPKFDSSAYESSSAEISSEVVGQLCQFVELIAGMYRSNPFHNFDHASHVSQSTSKLLSRIVGPKANADEELMHDHTYGITSDPLTQFACIFSSLIHDVDHHGVPNFILAKEDPGLASAYHQKAIAEQNSVDVAWNLLMDPSFEALRGAIYSNESELRRFRQLVVNSVMATDIFDKELGALRKKRWDRAFSPDSGDEFDDDSEAITLTKKSPEVGINRKATIVIEHIIQAADISHTCQHWHVYTKWNQRLFNEMYLSYVKGRSDKDPSVGWYEGELWFFDNYVIPLAGKLKECGVFGVSSDEYLNYAKQNRREWEKKGKAIVADNLAKYKQVLKKKGLSRDSIGSGEEKKE